MGKTLWLTLVQLSVTTQYKHTQEQTNGYDQHSD